MIPCPLETALSYFSAIGLKASGAEAAIVMNAGPQLKALVLIKRVRVVQGKEDAA